MATDYDFIIRKGDVGIGTSTPGAKLHVSGSISGSSINFGQDTLNYYDEGTWTPVINTVNSNIGTVTYNDNDGTYTRIGNVVHAWFYLDIAMVVGGVGTGTSVINSLPFTSGTGLPYYPMVVVIDGGALAVGTAGQQVKGQVPSNATNIQLDYYNSGTAGFAASTSAEWKAVGGVITGYATYQI